MFNKIFLILFLISTNSLALQLEEFKMPKEYQPIKARDGALSWTIFASTKEKDQCKIIDGYDYCFRKPIYSKEILALNNKKVKIIGYMFPLSQESNQNNFLIGPYPLSCPFHYHVGPNQIIEAQSKKPIKFSYEPIIIEGTLIVEFDEENEVFFFLRDAIKK